MELLVSATLASFDQPWLRYQGEMMSDFKQPKPNPLPTEKTKDLKNTMAQVKDLASKPLHDAGTKIIGKGLK